MQVLFKKYARARAFQIGRRVGIATLAIAAACGTTEALAPSVTNALNAIAGTKLFVDPANPARKQADKWRSTRPADAALMDRIATQPIATWINEWAGDVQTAVAGFVTKANRQGATPVFVAYNIPNRDCGSYSAGGSSNASAYRTWIRDFAKGLGASRAIVVLEPDAVAGASCLSTSQRDERYGLLRDAIQVLKSAHAAVYLDAGNPTWLSTREIASRLQKAGIATADGFSLNVSNYISTSRNVEYGNAVSQLVGGKHYIIDTSRNGLGGRGDEWCNVPDQALGAAPTTQTGRALVDAYLWIKVPGESDGTCNGGPHSGAWWPSYALELARNESQVATTN